MLHNSVICPPIFSTNVLHCWICEAELRLTLSMQAILCCTAAVCMLVAILLAWIFIDEIRIHRASLAKPWPVTSRWKTNQSTARCQGRLLKQASTDGYKKKTKEKWFSTRWVWTVRHSMSKVTVIRRYVCSSESEVRERFCGAVVITDGRHL